jgi:hypothetical protein
MLRIAVAVAECNRNGKRYERWNRYFRVPVQVLVGIIGLKS